MMIQKSLFAASLAVLACSGWAQVRERATAEDTPVPAQGVFNAPHFQALRRALHPQAAGGGSGSAAAPVVNAASQVVGAVAPGSLVTLTGTFPVTTAFEGEAPLPTSLAGVGVQLNGVLAPLLYVSATQVTFQVPWEMAGQTVADVTVGANMFTHDAGSLALAPTAPGLFSIGGTGSGAGAIQDLLYRAIDAENPATAGTTVIRILCTGLGVVSNQPASGAAALFSPRSMVVPLPTVTIGSVPASVLYAALTPGLVGVYEVDVSVPAAAPTGAAVPVVMTAGSVVSNTVTIPVVSAGGSGGAPVIVDAGPILAQPTQTVTIRGGGFGDLPNCGARANCIDLTDNSGNWALSSDALQIVSWSNTRIDLTLVPPSGKALTGGDQITIRVWNAQTGVGPGVYMVPVGPWQLVWSDEFNGPANTSADAKIWGYDLGGGGWGNNELETYTNSTVNSHTDGKGNLVIHADAPNTGGYTSARLKSQGLFAIDHGRVEARIKVPYGQGIWPAFWLLGIDIADPSISWPGCGEVDIMENIGKEPSIAHGTLHGPNVVGGHSDYSVGTTYTLPGGAKLSDDFHTFGVDWTSTSMTFRVDGNAYLVVNSSQYPQATPWVFNHPFFIIMNIAIGGTTSWGGTPDKTTVFPQEMLVDWVRVYQPAPSYRLDSWSGSFSSSQSTGSVGVIATVPPAPWTAVSNVPWVIITSGASGAGSGRVTFNVLPNTTKAPRSGTMTIAGQPYLLNQQ